LEVAARLLLRSEGVASSAIEGVRAPVADVAVARAEPAAVGETAAWVADNLAVVDEAVADTAPLTTERLHGWHTRLMRHGSLAADLVGSWRDRLVWVGGANPLVARHVGTPPDLVDGCMADLIAFANGSELDAVSTAALVHAQFETIHPFADGNGRLGRVLVGWVLARRIPVRVPPPVSLVMARDIGGYLSGLHLFQDGRIDLWVRWFAEAVEAAAGRARVALGTVREVVAGWDDAVAPLRADAAARRLVPFLLEHPALTTGSVRGLLDVSAPTARTALDELTRLGVLVDLGPIPAGPGRPSRWWVAQSVLDLLGP
jgi:Fic family protein